MTGLKVTVWYASGNNPKPVAYRGTVETVKNLPKGRMILLRLDQNRGYRSLYINKAHTIQMG